MWRRLEEVPFYKVVPPDRRDPRLKEVLRDPSIAGPAIMAWAVQGCLAWQRAGGLHAPLVVKEATADYRAESDRIKDFLAECCDLRPDAWTASEDVRREYDKWAKEWGIKYPLVGTELWGRLKRHGCSPKTRNNRRGWLGLDASVPTRERENAAVS